jgi:hypothetical protein
MTLKSSNTASTVIPSNLNGMDRIQTIGYRINATNASGQQTKRRINQRMNFVMYYLHISVRRDASVGCIDPGESP